MTPRALSACPRLLVAACLCAGTVATPAAVTVNGTTFSLQELVGVGRIAANLHDEHGETFGSISGLVADRSSWTRVGDSYTGTFYAAPDRGYNVVGTIDYTARINRIEMSFTPAAAGASGLGQNQIGLSLTQSTLLRESLTGSSRPISGLDPVPGGVAKGGARPATGLLPELPQGYNGKLSLDAEGIVVLRDGSRLISDEYGPSMEPYSGHRQTTSEHVALVSDCPRDA